jgi:hypothetical protein
MATVKPGWWEANFFDSQDRGNFLGYFYFQPIYFIYTKVIVDTVLAVW